MKIRECIKKVVAGTLVSTMMLVGVLFFPVNTEAASYSYEDKIVYDDSVANAVTLYNKHEAPTKAGYVFGGWFSDDEGNTQVTTETVEAGTTLFAKFVPAYVLSVRAQNHNDVSSTGNVRLVSGVDNNAHYKVVGFEVYFANKEANYAYGEGTTVYQNIKAGDSTYTAPEVFGTQANYFNIVEIEGISNDNFDKIIYAKPYWITNDNTKVYGLPKYVCINDGINEIISIPVNLYTAQQIAAGIVEVVYPETLTYQGYHYSDESASRLFSEMELNVNETTRTIKCVGNVADVNTGNLEANKDIYVSLKFKITDEDIKLADQRFSLTVNSIQFCNWAETTIPMSDYVWDIQY